MATSNPGPAVTTANQTSIGYTNNLFDVFIGATLSPVSVAANTTAEQTFTVTGLAVGVSIGLVTVENLDLKSIHQKNACVASILTDSHRRIWRGPFQVELNVSERAFREDRP